ncbi:hypothetical protein GP486_004502 [Trichoglossum hirsutum]|uniref:BSD domain-containing protein n=1 Tax=Trichoglossum hirsutum TaxID=265104 RepID=A0A9P8LB18_9PEZI|nr:hypothetical protein GP486_004502 [Trichoglossum hirsutum]
MDVAYDHIQEETLPPHEEGERKNAEGGTLDTEFQEAYKAISSSPWGARFGAFMGTVKRQGESYYEGARQEYSTASEQATRGFTSLTSSIISRTRSLSLSASPDTDEPSSAAHSNADTQETTGASKGGARSESEALRESEGVLARFRSEASKRLKDIEKAEDAADEALLKFGNNIRNFLRDAVTIAPPAEDAELGPNGKAKVLFESKGDDGKRVFHTTRFDAQLHVVHSSLDSFSRDPSSPEYSNWLKGFSVDSKTEQIAKDLEGYPELRNAMEKLVPDRVAYKDFWTRYYFLRHVVETEEQRRKEMLKGAVTEDEEVNWDEDSDSDASPPSKADRRPPGKPESVESSGTLRSSGKDAGLGSPPLPKPGDEGKSHDQYSQPDSDASYDVVSGAPSGAPSHAPGSPIKKKSAEDSDEEDWE